MTEQELIDGCIKNSRVAQKELFDRFYTDMVGLCLLYCKNEDDARWVTNQGFVDAFKHMHTFEGKAKLKTWLKRIVINRAISFYRKEKKQKERYLHLDKESTAYKQSEASVNMSVLEQLKVEDLMRMIRSLPVMERSVFTMHQIEGYSHREIGEMLSIPEGTSRSYLSKARKTLQKLLLPQETHK